MIFFPIHLAWSALLDTKNVWVRPSIEVGDSIPEMTGKITVFLEKKGSYETFMEEEPAKTLFGDDFYRRIVQHDRVPLIKALFSYQDVPWKEDKMRELAEERTCKKVVAYLKDRQSSPTVSALFYWYQSVFKVVDPREELDRKIREDLADKIKGAVIEANALKLEVDSFCHLNCLISAIFTRPRSI